MSVAMTATTSRRFDSAEYLRAFTARRTFPVIHDALFNLVAEEATGSVFLDLCCSTGLLGERIAGIAGWSSVGVETDLEAIGAGRRAGVTMPILEARIGWGTLPELERYVVGHAVDVLVARRCFPELFGTDAALGREFARLIRAAGVKEVFLQGRAQTARPANSLHTVYLEAELLEAEYRLVRAHNQCAYLKART